MVLSVIGGLIFALIGHVLSNVMEEPVYGGDKAGIVWAIVFGVPLGSVIGFFLIDKYIYHFPRDNFLGMVIGFLCGSVSGGVAGGVLLDAIGGKALLIIPLLVVCFCLIGYQIGFKRALRKISLHGEP
jgi:predicted MFS family arabinose efflux permease